ncbi:neutral cholesterol ester hydrolase 1-like [Branchiostoma lanceolatum]|uniref:neutral cholesterol ester hydrolase 1-like n=1 Tax=Branchiostoma lanceolatum TaxID=7740 RepID=UPI003452FB94
MVWVEVAIAMSALGVLAYWRYTPVPPEGISDRESRKGKLRMKKILVDLASVLEFLDVTTVVQFLRASLKYMSPPTMAVPESLLKVSETTFDGVKVMVLEPLSAQRQSAVPGLVYYHGGGFCSGTTAGCFPITSHLALELGIVVIVVDYRLAPEHKFPAGLNDCVTATKYFLRHARRYNVDPFRIGIAGDSAGGNFAAVVALKLAREKQEPALKLQVLLNPVTQLLMFTASAYKYGPSEVRSIWQAYFTSVYLYGNRSKVNLVHADLNPAKLEGTHYLNFVDPSLVDSTIPPLPPGRRVRREDVAAGEEELEMVLNPDVSPLLAEEDDMKDLPPTFISAMEFDVFRDDAIFYAKRLEKAGVEVKMLHYKNGYHGQIGDFKWSETARGMMGDVLFYLKENL